MVQKTYPHVMIILQVLRSLIFFNSMNLHVHMTYLGSNLNKVQTRSIENHLNPSIPPSFTLFLSKTYLRYLLEFPPSKKKKH